MGTKDPKNAARWGVNAGKDHNQTTKSLIYPIVDQIMIPGGSPGNPSYDRLVQSRETLDIFVKELPRGGACPVVWHLGPGTFFHAFFLP